MSANNIKGDIILFNNKYTMVIIFVILSARTNKVDEIYEKIVNFIDKNTEKIMQVLIKQKTVFIKVSELFFR